MEPTKATLRIMCRQRWTMRRASTILWGRTSTGPSSTSPAIHRGRRRSPSPEDFRLPVSDWWVLPAPCCGAKKLLTPMAIQKDSRRAYFRLRSTNRIWQITSFWLFIFSNISAKNYQNRLLSDIVCRPTRSHQIWDVFTGARTQCRPIFLHSTRS